mmetsp:Transcript_10632/g.22508  ORF Transcript_10632/g.22508 Transcript_10632/m.22508 type:complete len:117 (-) Transcript_10632:202-552(-)
MVHARSAQPDDAPILGTVHDRSCLRWLFYHRVLKESAEFGERVERRWPDATALDLFPYQCARNAVAAPSHRQGALLTLEAAGERLALALAAEDAGTSRAGCCPIGSDQSEAAGACR